MNFSYKDARKIIKFFADKSRNCQPIEPSGKNLIMTYDLQNTLWHIAYNIDSDILEHKLKRKIKKDLVELSKLAFTDEMFYKIQGSLIGIARKLKMREMDTFLFNVILIEHNNYIVNAAKDVLKEITEDVKTNT